MPHERLAAHHSVTVASSSDEPLDAIVDLADAIRALTSKFDHVQHTLDDYEISLLHTESRRLPHQQPHAQTLAQWQEFMARVKQELDALVPLI